MSLAPKHQSSYYPGVNGTGSRTTEAQCTAKPDATAIYLLAKAPNIRPVGRRCECCSACQLTISERLILINVVIQLFVTLKMPLTLPQTLNPETLTLIAIIPLVTLVFSINKMPPPLPQVLAGIWPAGSQVSRSRFHCSGSRSWV